MSILGERLIIAIQEAKERGLVSIEIISDKEHQLSLLSRMPKPASLESVKQLEAGGEENLRNDLNLND